MRVLITGIAGFIGSHLAEKLISQGHTVTGVDNFSSGKQENLPHAGAVCYHCNCMNDMKLRYVISETKPEFIYHLAATVGVNRVLEDPKKCIENNIESTRNVLAFGIPGIFASTSEVYGKTDEVLKEESPLIYSHKSRWSYAASKLIGEFLVQNTRGWKSVRFFNVVGPRQSTTYGAVLPNFVSQSLDGKPLTVYGDGQQIRSFIDVRDCVEILDVLREKDFDVVNVGGIHTTTIRSLAYKVIDYSSPYSCTRGTERVDYSKVHGEGFEECVKRVPDLTKLRSLIGDFKYRNFGDTITDLANHIKEQRVKDSCKSILNERIDELNNSLGIPNIVRREQKIPYEVK